MSDQDVCPHCGVDWNEVRADSKDLRLLRAQLEKLKEELAAKERRIKELEGK